jgi:dienelactone hydrolase
MQTTRGTIDVIQCITEITPLWTKVESTTHVWDMRISTSSIPPDVLARIFAKLVGSENVEGRERVALFYLQAERFQESFRVFQEILDDFPNDAELQERLKPSIQAIRQRWARRLLNELKLRRDAGQHGLVEEKLRIFPSEGVAGDILEEVRQIVEQYESRRAQREQVLTRFDELEAQIESEVTRERIAPIREEIAAELGPNTLARLAPFWLRMDDDSEPEVKLALAISGWLMGSDSAIENLPVALSAYDVRGLVRRYLSAGDALSRAQILAEFYSQEAGIPSMVAQIVANMKPPIDLPAEAELAPPGQPASVTLTAAKQDVPAELMPGLMPLRGKLEVHVEEAEAAEEAPPAPAGSGYYELEVPGSRDAPPVKYLVQLPPDYDPYRRYPTIVTLHAAHTTPEHQVSWWSGDWREDGQRWGLSGRYGYIVIAPAWAAEHQKQYAYSVREHDAVLGCLRHASRRLSIDTDRVYLTGFSMGGDAAWDIGLAHPDLWAGVIPIAARSDKYCSRYWENAKHVPFYYVVGEYDADRLVANAQDLDRYLKGNFSVTVVEYLGRGHEHFSDEIQRLFDWMGRYRRNFFPEEFEAYSMRPWDSSFWWVELAGMPPKSMVEPIDWPRRGAQPFRTRGKITATNGLNVTTGAANVRVWLSPEMVDLDERVLVVVNNRRISPPSQFIEPNLETLLEDVRRRGDRQHPFWAKLESATGRVHRGR